MVAIPLPVQSSPGEHPHEGAGRLVNCFALKLGDGAGTPVSRKRVPGMTEFATSANTVFRGMKQVGGDLYSAWTGKVYKVGEAGGAMTELTGNLTGAEQVFFAANNAALPDVVIAVPGEGAFIVTGGATVASYPDADVGTPNSVTFHKGFFIFTYGDGKVRASGVNSTSVNTLDVATAEYRRDTLYRPMSYKGTLLLFGSESREHWGGTVNDTGFPFSYIGADDVGLIGPYAATGDEEGFNGGVHFVGSDFRVRRVEGYQSLPVSLPDLERLIARVEDKTTICMGCYVTNGMPIVVVYCDDWCWELNLATNQWNERESYLVTTWRGLGPTKAFDKWLCGDRNSGNIYEIDPTNHREADEPLRQRIETGPIGDFPNKLRVDRLELYMTRGIGIAAGDDPEQTNPQVEITMSGDGGYSWNKPRAITVGRQAVMKGRVVANSFGHAHPQGVRFRIDIADAVPDGIMGADMQASPLR